MQIYKTPWMPVPPYHFNNYADAFVKIIGPVVNSLIVTVISIVVAVVSSLMASYSFSRGEYPLHKFLYVIIIALLMVPGFALLVPQFVQFNRLGLSNTYIGQALPPATNSVALGVMLMTAFFNQIPRSLFESAEIDGAGEMTVLRRIVLPLSTPIVSSVAIMTGLATWNNYVWPLVITKGDTVKPAILAITSMAGNVNQGDGIKLAAYVIASLPVIVLFFFATKPFIEGITAGAVKG